MNKKTLIQGGVVVGGLAFLVFYNLNNMGMFSGAAAVKPAALTKSIDEHLVSAVESSPLGGTVLNLRRQMIEMAKAEEATKLQPAIEERYYLADDLRDPFISLLPRPIKVSADGNTVLSAGGAAMESGAVAIPQLPPDLKVSGMLLGGDNPVAIISRKVYSVGDNVMGATIKAIDRVGVTFEYQGMVTILPVQNQVSR